MLFLRRYSSITEGFDNFLHKSVIPTNFFINKIFNLPLPKLEDSKQKLLSSAKPLLTGSELEALATEVDSYNSTNGQSAHEFLKKKAKHQNFMADFWLKNYLQGRNSLPILANPILIFQEDQQLIDYATTNKENLDVQSLGAARLVNSALRFKNTLQSNILSPDVYGYNFHNLSPSDKRFHTLVTKMPGAAAVVYAYLSKKYPLDMSQYYSLFGTCRIPNQMCDHLTTSANSEHIVVAFRGNFYSLSLKCLKVSSGKKLFVEQTEWLYNCMQAVKEAAHSPSDLGLLTCLKRDDWAGVRAQLIQHNDNAKKLRCIQDALMVVCLDEDAPKSNTPEDVVPYFMKSYSSSRFFDKSISLIFDKNGRACINFEHSWGDGMPVLRFLEEVSRDVAKTPHKKESVAAFNKGKSYNLALFNNKRDLCQLDFALDSSLKGHVERAKKQYFETLDNLLMEGLLVEGINRRVLKKCNINSDALVQIVYQAAFYHTFKFIPSVYESANMLAFKSGRTDTLRPLTEESKLFVEEFVKAVGGEKNQLNDNKEKLRGLLNDASNKHNKMIVDILKGGGFDRHFFSMNFYDNERGMNGSSQQELFTPKSPYQNRLNNYQLSSSTVSSELNLLGCFGPPAINCIGVPYRINNEMAATLLTAFTVDYQSKHQSIDKSKCLDVLQFKNSLEKYFSAMSSLLN